MVPPLGGRAQPQELGLSYSESLGRLSEASRAQQSRGGLPPGELWPHLQAQRLFFSLLAQAQVKD